MPVKSLNSSVLNWPNRAEVMEALSRWALDAAASRPELIAVGCFGSYARGDWGVGSDLDVVLIVEGAQVEFVRRAAQWDLTHLPVPVDVLVYKSQEWEALAARKDWNSVVTKELLWVWKRSAAGIEELSNSGPSVSCAPPGQ